MQKIQPIKTIKSFTSEYKLKEKGSSFIAQALPITSVEEANEKLEAIKKKYYDATHHCFGYKTHTEDFKYSDDGEPTGTAGIRIINAIEHFSLIDLILIVTRYYGGTKLGIGPLGKAYYNSAVSALENSNIIEKNPYNIIKLVFNFNMLKTVYKTLEGFDSKIIGIEYSDKVNFELAINANDVEIIRKKLLDLSNGEIIVSADNKISYM